MSSWRDELLDNEHLKAFRDHLLTLSKYTVDSYLFNLKWICEYIEIPYSEFNPLDLTQNHYDGFYRDHVTKVKRSTINLSTNVFRCLSRLYNLNIETTLLKPTDRYTDYVTFEELQEIIKNADKEVATVAAFLFCTGLRTVSMLKITKEQLLLNVEYPYIKSVYLKGGKYQDIAIIYPDILKPLLKWYIQYKTQNLKGYSDNPLVFVSQKGYSTNSYVYKLVTKCSEVIGRNCYPRMFRKGLGIHTKQIGIQDNVRKMILGHTDVRTTIEAYSEYSIRDIAREMKMKSTPHKVNPAGSVFPVQPVQNNRGNGGEPAQEFCPYCNNVVDPTMILCPHCWKEIKKICSNCKSFINSKWKKCPYCGTPAEKTEAEGHERALFWNDSKK